MIRKLLGTVRMRRTLYRSRRRRRLGVRGLVALVIIGGAVAGVAFLSRDAGGEQAAGLAAAVAAGGRSAPELIARLGAAHRLVLLADIHGSAAPKRLAARAVEALANGPGLDGLAVEVGADLQPVLDRYLATSPEDASILLANPRVLNTREGTSQATLELYRTVYRLNRELGADRSIRILAVDLPEWPPTEALSPRDAAMLFGGRDARMTDELENRLLSRVPRARVLVFVGGLHTLRGVTAQLRAGGGEPVEVIPLAERLATRYPGEVAGVLTDEGAAPGGAVQVASYAGTRAYDLLRAHLEEPGATMGARVTQAFGFVRDPIRARVGPGLELELTPGDVRLPDVARGYVYLGSD